MLFPSFKEANGDSRSLNPENFIEMEQGMSSSPINVADGCCHRQAVAQPTAAMEGAWKEDDRVKCQVIRNKITSSLAYGCCFPNSSP